MAYVGGVERAGWCEARVRSVRAGWHMRVCVGGAGADPSADGVGSGEGRTGRVGRASRSVLERLSTGCYEKTRVRGAPCCQIFARSVLLYGRRCMHTPGQWKPLASRSPSLSR